MPIDKEFYNQASSAKLGWTPVWFGCENFDEELLKAVRKFQREHGLTADGLVGPMTHRRIFTEREADIGSHVKRDRTFKDDNVIIHNGNPIPIEWDKVILWSEEHGLKTKPGNYNNYAGKPDREPITFVNHWDVCLSSESCAKVLAKRGISVHFCIDNDGTIYQLLDTQHAAWHAAPINRQSIGVEVANAYYTKYQSWYERHGFGARPLWEGKKVHGRTQKPFLGFYDIQLDAMKALWKAIHIGIGIPLQTPVDDKNRTSDTLSKDVSKGKYHGFVSHYHVTKRKIDCAGLDIQKMLEDVKSSPMYCLDR